MTKLDQLAAAAGLEVDWEDAGGVARRVDDAALRRVLAALGSPAESERDIAESLARLGEEAMAISFLSGDLGAPILADGVEFDGNQAELILEDGRAQTLEVSRTPRGLQLAAVHTPGYHRLRLGGRELRLAVAPPVGFGLRDIGPRRLWGPAIQVPSLRDARNLAFGDFGALAAAAKSFAAAGADAMAISPTHALFPADARRFSPYAPSSRLFLNILFGDPSLIGHPSAPGPTGELIDWAEAIPARLAALRQAYDQAGDAVKAAVEAFRVQGGPKLERHAIFDALHGRFFADGATGWQDWPAAYQDPKSRAVSEFAAAHPQEIGFFVFAQWLANLSLHAAQSAATGAGMAIGLIADLAVGMDPGGSQAWSGRDELLTGLSIGAPPDLLGPDGQSWGITSFSPTALRRTGFEAFIATLRAGLDHAGGLRIDHILGLRRLWIVPDGAPSSAGAYLKYPLEDMLRILSIESHRAKGVIIGEDLGTVPVGLRPRLAARQILGMRVLWFERDASDGFIPPAEWPADAVAMTGTHDLPTVAGWWRGHDIAWRRRVGQSAAADGEADLAARARDRARLWDAMQASGAARGQEPAPDQPAAVVDAALAHVAGAPCGLAIFPLEDIVGLEQQPNLPGTTDQHPNWRRRMPAPIDELIDRPGVGERLQRLKRMRTP